MVIGATLAIMNAVMVLPCAGAEKPALTIQAVLNAFTRIPNPDAMEGTGFDIQSIKMVEASISYANADEAIAAITDMNQGHAGGFSELWLLAARNGRWIPIRKIDEADAIDFRIVNLGEGYGSGVWCDANCGGMGISHSRGTLYAMNDNGKMSILYSNESEDRFTEQDIRNHREGQGPFIAHNVDFLIYGDSADVMIDKTENFAYELLADSSIRRVTHSTVNSVCQFDPRSFRYVPTANGATPKPNLIDYATWNDQPSSTENELTQQQINAAKTLLRSHTCALFDQPNMRFVTPVDKSGNIPGLQALWAGILQAHARRDFRWFTTHCSNAFEWTFGDCRPGDMQAFRRFWETTPGGMARFWEELGNILRLGGAFNSQGAFWVPSTDCRMPLLDEGIDPYHLLVTDTDVAVYSRPDKRSAVLETLSYEIIHAANYEDIVRNPEPEGWRLVVTMRGNLGWMESRKLRSNTDYRLIIAHADGEWKIEAFIAGD